MCVSFMSWTFIVSFIFHKKLSLHEEIMDINNFYYYLIILAVFFLRKIIHANTLNTKNDKSNI